MKLHVSDKEECRRIGGGGGGGDSRMGLQVHAGEKQLQTGLE